MRGRVVRGGLNLKLKASVHRREDDRRDAVRHVRLDLVQQRLVLRREVVRRDGEIEYRS